MGGRIRIRIRIHNRIHNGTLPCADGQQMFRGILEKFVTK